MSFARAGVPAFAVGAAGAIFLAVLLPALKGVFVASLYQFATAGTTPTGFDRELLGHAFRSKKP